VIRFKDKVAVVTGGCRGIGKAIVERFANEGATVFALDYIIPDEKNFLDSKTSSSVICIQVDVTDEESVNAAFNKIVEMYSKIDILVNNAGITRDNLILRMTTEQWDSVIDTNLKGAFLCTKLVAKAMFSQRYGKIINIGSVVGSIGNAGQANYSASKAGLIGFTKSIAKEFGSRNINVNLVAPGFVNTPMTDKLTDEQKKQYLENIPLRRAAEPEDIASVVAFLATDDAGYITGQVIHIDGGLAL
jgi:3-oxoacyl-[acyl-carrier protein] reductase